MGLDANKNIWEDFFSLLRSYRKEIIQVYVLGLVLSLLSLMFPIGIQLLINFIQGANYSVSLFVIIFLMGASIILAAIFQIYQIRIIEYIEQKLFADYSFKFVEKFPSLNYLELIYQNARDVANRFFDVVTLQKMVQKILIDFSYSSIIIVLSLILLCFYHPIFIVMVLILFVILYFGIKFTFRKGLESGISYSKYKYDTAYWIEETGNASVTLKLAGETDIHFQKLQNTLKNYFLERNNHYYVLEKQFILLHTIKFVTIIFFVIVGGILVIEQQMNIGEFVASEIVISILVNSFDKMVFLIRTIYDLIISLAKIKEVLDLKEETFKSKTNNENHLDYIKIDLKDVTYEYEYPKRIVLENINLQILPQESVLLIGESHSGKTTLLKLLATLITPTKGHFLINDRDLNTYDISKLRYQIGTYLSNDVIFKGTILENIHLGREYDMNFLMEMSQKIGIDKMIYDLPDKYETEMFTYGFNYSTSFITKLLFLRAIVTQPKLLILENMFNTIYEKDVPILLDIACNTKEYGWTTIISSSDAKYKNYFTKILQIKDGKLLMYDDVGNYPY
ncbi:MAG: ATP-binding cassette domain-containing protein [Bacteroidia bacterium]